MAARIQPQGTYVMKLAKDAFRCWLWIACLCGTALWAQTNSPVLVSHRDPSLPKLPGAALDSVPHSMTPDGRWVLFSSAAHNLVQSESAAPLSASIPEVVNVYLRDRSNAATHLVSKAANGWAGASADCTPAGVSADGRWVVFESAATNLVETGGNGIPQVFMRDVVVGSNVLVSTATNGAPANGECRSAAMTPDGRFVVFVSAANNLTAWDTNSIPDVFRRDTHTGITELISAGALAPTSGGTLAPASERPVMTPDGRFVAFMSTAAELAPDVPAANARRLWDVYLRDTETRTTTWPGKNIRQLALPYLGSTSLHIFNHSLSDQGETLVCQVALANASTGMVFRVDLPTEDIQIIHSNSIVAPGGHQAVSDLPYSGNGKALGFVAALPVPENTNASGIVVWDWQSGANRLASADTEGRQFPGLCKNPVLDPGGRFVAFISNGMNPTNSGDFMDLYCRDLVSGTEPVLSNTDQTGERLELAAANPLITTNGHMVFSARRFGETAYQVYAKDLASGTLELVSPAALDLPNQAASLHSGINSFALSSDGTKVVFYSHASDLVPSDTNNVPDIFVRDLRYGTNWLISVNSNGLPANDVSTEAVLSANGRFVAYTSRASDIVPNDTNAATDVFIRDLETGTNFLVSSMTNGLPGMYRSLAPQLSADGTKMLFQTFSRGMAPGSQFPGISWSYSPDLVFCDLTTGNRVSFTRDGVQPNAVAMSADGEWIIYHEQTSWSSTTGTLKLYNTVKQTTTNVTSSTKPISISIVAASDPTGRRLVYATNQYLGTVAGLAYYDLQTWSHHDIALIRAGFSARFCFSADGEFMAYSGRHPQASNLISRIYVHSFGANTNVFTSEGPLVPPSANHDLPDLSPDGRFIVYRETLPDSEATSSTLSSSLVLQDLSNGATLRMAQGNGLQVGPPRFSGDGRTLIYTRQRGPGSDHDFNSAADIYAVRLSPGGDIPVFYATLAQNSEGWLLTWPVEPNKQYKVQYKGRLEDAVWTELSGQVTIEGTQGKLLDPAATEQRFYRVVAY